MLVHRLRNGDGYTETVAGGQGDGTMSDSLVKLQNDVADHLEQIAALFVQRPKITIVIRTPWLEEGKDGGVVLSDDDFDAAIAEINRLRNRKPVEASR